MKNTEKKSKVSKEMLIDAANQWVADSEHRHIILLAVEEGEKVKEGIPVNSTNLIRGTGDALVQALSECCKETEEFYSLIKEALLHNILNKIREHGKE